MEDDKIPTAERPAESRKFLHFVRCFMRLDSEEGLRPESQVYYWNKKNEWVGKDYQHLPADKAAKAIAEGRLFIMHAYRADKFDDIPEYALPRGERVPLGKATPLEFEEATAV